MNQSASRRHAGGGPRSSEGLACATVTKRTEDGGARTEALADARPLDVATRCCSPLRLRGDDESEVALRRRRNH
jgi:hypothetical protein